MQWQITRIINYEWETESCWDIKRYSKRYYRISWEGRVVDDTWTDTQDEKICYEFGNCFKTYDEAKAASYKVQEILNK